MAGKDHRYVVGIESRHSPEGIVDKSIEQLGRQQSRSFDPFNLAAYRMEIRRAERDIEVVGFKFDIIEIVGEPFFAQEFVKLFQRVRRPFRQCFVADQNKPVGMLSPKGLAQGIKGKADEPTSGWETCSSAASHRGRLTKGGPALAKVPPRLSRPPNRARWQARPCAEPAGASK
jgi:hypothetical protein